VLSVRLEPEVPSVSPEPEGRLLVVDDDPDITRFVEMNFNFEGFDVVVANDGYEALAEIDRQRPDLVLLDVMMPRMDGVELCRRLRADPMTTGMPVIMLTAKGLSADKVAGLTAGADDYIVKPFDMLELVARVRSTLRRNREVRGMSPLTGLPGNTRILSEIRARVGGRGEFAVCYVDLDNFKSVNDAYGFVRGDEMITALARALERACSETNEPAPFLGHVGGDDFVVLCAPNQVADLIDRTVAAFDAALPGLYDPRDYARGCLDLRNRRGVMQSFDLVTVSAGVAVSTQRVFSDPREVVAVATEMKQVAKSSPGSVVAVDRRHDHRMERG
jgi:PleD family two-component response regulator